MPAIGAGHPGRTGEEFHRDRPTFAAGHQADVGGQGLDRRLDGQWDAGPRGTGFRTDRENRLVRQPSSTTVSTRPALVRRVRPLGWGVRRRATPAARELRPWLRIGPPAVGAGRGNGLAMLKPSSPEPADDVLLNALRWAMAISVRAADQLGDLSPVQLRALTALQENPGANLNDLATAMGVTVSTSSRLVDRLVAAGLVDRKPSEQTRREITLTLTRSGRARLKLYDRHRLAEARACLESVPSAERDAVVTALQQFIGGAGPA